jgi:hypothetical protein
MHSYVYYQINGCVLGIKFYFLLLKKYLVHQETPT